MRDPLKYTYIYSSILAEDIDPRDIPVNEIIVWVRNNWWWIKIVGEKIYTFIIKQLKKRKKWKEELKI